MSNVVSLYGVDVSAMRADDLDRLMIADIQGSHSIKVLDLGCGRGGQSVRLAKTGAQVTSIDISDYSVDFARHKSENRSLESRLKFMQGNLSNIATLISGGTFDVCCLQRVIHYVTYKEAVTLLRYLKTCIEGKLYVSVTGIESEIGKNYADRQKVVADRFCRLGAQEAKTFFITEPVCLYTQEEFETLLTTAGWSIEQSWLSAFGNSKAVCS
jgi:SAM-dependent methyltransferase